MSQKRTRKSAVSFLIHKNIEIPDKTQIKTDEKHEKTAKNRFFLYNYNDLREVTAPQRLVFRSSSRGKLMSLAALDAVDKARKIKAGKLLGNKSA